MVTRTLSALSGGETTLHIEMTGFSLCVSPAVVAYSKSVNPAAAPGYLDVVKNPIGEGLVDEGESFDDV